MLDWKIGDRVEFSGNSACPADVGTVTSVCEDGEVWATWDSDGESNHFEANNTRFTKISSAKESETEEQKAVMLLLSLGYTITKMTGL